MKKKEKPSQAAESDQALRSRIGELAFEVTQNGATEGPYTGKYVDFFENGLYVDVIDGEPLFSSQDKFKAGCGWASFTRPVSQQALEEFPDLSGGNQLMEIRSRSSGAHLGHVFNSMQKEFGLRRYSVNSAALRFVPYEALKDSRYEKLLPIFEVQQLKVYFAASIRGGRVDSSLYRLMIRHIRRQGHTVLTEHSGSLNLFQSTTDQDIYQRDIDWLRKSDFLISECTSPSLGVGYELAFAEAEGKPCYIFYDHNKIQLSAMLTGNEYFHVFPYTDHAEIFPILDQILREEAAKALMRSKEAR